MSINILEKYIIYDSIGKGNFGIINKVKSRKSNNFYVLKSPLKDNSTKNELKILKKLKNKNIIKLVDYHDSQLGCFLILEPLAEGDLFDVLDKYYKFNENTCCKILHNLLKPLLYLRKKYICHLDIKPENYLIKDLDNCEFLLSDFGSAHKYTKKNKLDNVVGTFDYAAPEIFSGKFYLNSDIFSIGKIAYILITGKSILKNTSFIKTGKYIDKINCSIQYKSFILNCLKQRTLRFKVKDAYFYIDKIGFSRQSNLQFSK